MTSSKHLIQDQPIAVVGVSALYPGQPGSEGFWNDILSGRDLIRDVPESHWLIDDYYDPDPSVPDKTYAKRGSFLPPVDFDTLAWGMPPSLVPMTDTTQLLALIVAQQVLQDAAGDAFEDMDRSRISVILGVTSAQELLGLMVARLQRPVWVKALRETGLSESDVEEACERIANHYTPWNESTFPGLLGNVVAGRIANRLNLGGTNCVTDAACASSFSAVSMAVNELLLGDSDMVITGGADTLNDIFMYMCFSKTPALSKSGECAPFSDQADGTLLGEGIGMVALKRLADAERDGNKIYAVLRGVGTSSDGRSKSVYAPVPEGQARALQRAYDQAGYAPRTVELVEAHGTGTTAGDAAEMAGLKLAFSDETGDRRWCALGTVKSQIGHTKAAAGAAGLFKVVMALHHRVLPPTLKVDTPNPSLGVDDSPFYLNTTSRPWIRGADHPRRASVSSFGFGGSNFHLTLEEYVGDGRPERMRATPAELVLLGAEGPESLAREARRIAETLTEGGFARLAHQSVHSPPEGPARAAIVATDAEDLRRQLTWLAGQIETQPDTALSTPQGGHYAHGQEPGGVALLFPGQGSQYVHMGRDVAIHLDAARGPLDAAADYRPDGQQRLSDVFLPPPVFTDAAAKQQEDALRATEWAQPCLGLTSLCYLELVEALNLNVTGALGHSFGELTALAASGALERQAFLELARARGELMAEAAKTPGAMTAAQAGEDELAPHAEAVEGVTFANYNSPTQTVLSGTVEGIEAVEQRLADAGIETRRLPVATAFHSPVVADAVPGFRKRLQDVDFHNPKWPVYSGSAAQPHKGEAASIREGLASGIADPVRFVGCVEDLYAQGARVFIEVGAGSVLTRLVSETLGDRPHQAIPMDRRSKPGWEALCESLGRLYVAGVDADYSLLWSGYAEPEEPVDTSARPTIPLSGSNYGKPYPPPGGGAALPPPNPKRAATPEPVPLPMPAPEAAAPAPVHHDPSPTGEPMSTQPPTYTDPWLLAFQEAQRATADAHASYQSAMRDSHVAYLHAMESSLHTLAHLAGGEPLPLTEAPRTSPPVVAPAVAVAPPAPAPAAPAPAPAPLVIPTATPAVSGPAVQRISDVVAAPAPTAQPTTPAQHVAAAPAPAPASAGLGDTLLGIVADKTGYPTDLLHLDMKLESDLGVDSIKRVEILSALREAIPSLPEVNPGDLAKLSTLGQIVEHLGDTVAPAEPATAAEAPQTNGLGGTLLGIVADKTGYPTDLLHLDMKLESDLGVDSIKRVEILSALREAIPSLPEVNPGDLAKLSTLGQIVEHLSGHAPSGPRKASPRESSHPSKEPPPMR